MEIVNNEYQISGVSVLEVCKEFGTPLYVYDANVIERNYNRLINAFKTTNVEIHYACKALTNINILKLMKKIGANLDTVSIQEVQIGLKAGFAPQEIMYTPNCVGMEEISKAVSLGVKINIDNISILEQFGNKYGDTYPICIRINPHIMAGGNTKISTGHIDSKFGISVYQLRHIERVVKSTNLKVEGLHMHTGSDILDVDVFLNGAELLFDAAKHFKDLEFLDLGSGFKVKYSKDDYSTNIEELGEKISERFNAFCTAYGKELKLIFEPGKFLVSESGFLFVNVNVIKQTMSTVFAGVDSGQNHLIRPMFYDAYHHITNVSNPEGKNRIYTVVGYICETDTFGWDRKLNEVREGDILCLHNAGAYGFSMSSNYNSRYRPAEVLIKDGKAILIRRRENLEDILASQIDAEI
ncbi:MAG TPA: diaminopimelate decarboxylase [Chitinophagales bacterium]|nr:diaminopimelate decarboxylase [Chitinophagales bacterium]HMW93588.1 diaminopimelate decarboxylase [Chitinophagales bacterium]HMY43083.1 diaminopimelate decarboxylase [Chitinophagales bacterium]HMZ94304.1 diaminopimelate decarboxylase [Chitinophagales bacterium]HNB39266.1 diaminopimelate decarboxylase [Chitinophagales bacterium]